MASKPTTKPTTKPIRIAVIGYGVIGKRVADAVKLQPDMELVGIADVVTDYRIRTAIVRGIPVYAARAESLDQMKRAGIPITGAVEDLLAMVDVVVDCTPKGIGAGNAEMYRAAGVKAVFQGGEKHSLTGHSFVAQANYESALDRNATRVVSCNTTSVVRTLGALRHANLLARARGVLIRRATDPWESDHGGIMNTVVPEVHVPSHQASDAKTVVPQLDVVTFAAKASHTQNHIHFWFVDLNREVDREEVLDAFKRAPRIAFVRKEDGIVGLNSTIELTRDLGRPRGDLWEVAVWEDTLTVQGRELFYSYQVDNESIAIPENIDAIRALSGTITDGRSSIRLTDECLGVTGDLFIPYSE